MLFRTARLLGQPAPHAVLVVGDSVAWIGPDAECPSVRADRIIPCGGATLAYGLHDAHIHLLAYASSLRRMDCGPSSARSIADIQRLVSQRAAQTPEGEWVRARGYDDFSLREGRHPTRHDLDAAAPRHPVQLDHRSGHACVLSTAALARVGIGQDTPDPPEGVIERDAGGAPTGLLFEMGSYVAQRTEERHDLAGTRKAVSKASQRLLSWGVTSLTDATPENDLARYEALRQRQAEGLLRQRVVFMPSVRHLTQFAERNLSFGGGDAMLSLGHAKLLVTLTTGGLQPSEPELRELVAQAHALGFPVAVHAVEKEAILAVLGVLSSLATNQAMPVCPNARVPGDGGVVGRLPDRIEHCSEATPAVVALLKKTGTIVCTNPGFLYESGARYRATVAREVLPWLYPARTLLEANVPLLAGSDAPVASPNPWQGVYAALTRRDAGGQALHPEQGVSLEQALGMYRGIGGAYGHRGIRVGERADLALLDRDVAQAEQGALLAVGAQAVMVGGEVVWER
ncbi:MAG: amidohydrolase [Chloroflexi bacterium]|nr:amidohydrolase [Chloroflexota bacterium]